MRHIVFFICILWTANGFSQNVWTDKFWMKEARSRYQKTGTMAGNYTSFYTNGNIKWQGKCLADGTPDSVWSYFFKDGELKWKGAYNGSFVQFKEDLHQDTLFYGSFLNGLCDGLWVFHDDYDTGTIDRKGFFNMGKPLGVWQLYDYDDESTKHFLYCYYTVETEKHNELSTCGDTIKSFNEELDVIEDYFAKEYTNFDYNIGMRIMNMNKINDAFLQNGYKGFSNDVYFGGIGISLNYDNFYQSYKLNYIPKTTSQFNDSTKIALSGYNAMVNYGGDLVNSKWLDICPNIGLGFEWYKLKFSYNEKGNQLLSMGEQSYKVYRNPSFFVSGMLDLRLNLSAISIGASAGYILDCTRTGWYYGGDYQKQSTKLSSSGWITMATFAFHFTD